MSRLEDVSSPVNLGNPGEFTIRELAREIGQILGCRIEEVEAPLPPDDPRQRRPDITRARELFGFEPKVGLREGIKRTIEEFRARLVL